jgi:hypothetical protein
MIEAAAHNGDGNERKSNAARTHAKLREALEAKGAVECTVDSSKDTHVKNFNVGTNVHDLPENVKHFILKDNKIGVFRRHTLFEYEEANVVTRGVFWQHYHKGGKEMVEYTLLMTNPTPSSILQPITIEIRTMEGKNLPKEIEEKLSHLR